MEGARWDASIESINDSLPKQLYTEMPVLHLSPQQNRPEPTENIYRCPVYRILSDCILDTTAYASTVLLAYSSSILQPSCPPPSRGRFSFHVN